MPIYEYDCRGCQRRISLLVRTLSAAPAPRCPRCGSEDLTRLLSRFVSPRSEEARLDAMADSADLGDVDENDPRSMARLMRRMGREFGEEMGEDFEEAVDEAMAESAADDGDDASGSDDSGDR
jgi:putative FmdB family regulatory protein